MNRDHFWLTDRQFARIAPHLPTDTRGKPRVDDRRVISGIVHVLKSGARWVDAPTVYGPRKTLYNRYVRWAAKGVFTWPVAPRGRPRQRPVPNIRPVAAHKMLGLQRWRTVTWRRGTKGPLRASFAAVRVRVADGTPTRAARRSGSWASAVRQASTSTTSRT